MSSDGNVIKDKWQHKHAKLMLHVEKLEKELDEYNVKYRNLEKKLRIALAMIQKLEPKN